MTDDACEQTVERLRLQIEAYHSAALVCAAAKLGLPETMGTERWTAEQLADRLSLSQPHLFRFLRVLSTIGICEEGADHSFALAPAGHALIPGSPSRLREKALIVVEQYWQPWANLTHSLKTGEPAFDHVLGTDVWNWRRMNADSSALFDAYLAQDTLAQASALVPVLDIPDTALVADIGGGNGALLAAVLKAHPRATGILFDQPQAGEAATPYLALLGVADRAAFIGGDFLTSLPIRADVYLLKSVLHDWDDPHCITILRICRAAMPEHAKLLVIERLLPLRAVDDPATIMIDMHMMVVTGGKERSLDEHRALLAQAQLSLAHVTESACGLSVLEAVPA